MDHNTVSNRAFVDNVNALLGSLHGGMTAKVTAVVLDRAGVHQAAQKLEDSPRWSGVTHVQAVQVVEDILDTYFSVTRREARR